MTKRGAMIIVGLLLASIAGAGSYRRVFSAETASPLQDLKTGGQVKEVSGYRHWARINAEPQLVISPSDMG